MSTALHDALVDAFRHHAQANLLSGAEAVESLLDYAFTMDELDTLLSYASADPSPSPRRCSDISVLVQRLSSRETRP